MNIDYTVTALMFPAIPLLMSVYGNKIAFIRYENRWRLIVMKINAVRAFIIASIVIIFLYALGLFLPIIMKSKSELIDGSRNKIVLYYNNLNNVW